MVLLAAAAKIPFEEQTLVAGTKQSSQMDKTGRPTSQAGQQGSLACLPCIGRDWYVLCLLPSTYFSKDFLLTHSLCAIFFS
jgi:hypothetical protein